ncbi:MAG: ABC transporter permease [Acidimicrobiales bacterium]
MKPRRAPSPVVATYIGPPSRRPQLGLRELWRARDLAVIFATRDVKLRYRQTILGVFWVLVGPTLAAAVFSFVFSSVAKLPSQHLPYFLYALAGMVGWTAFSNGLSRLSQVFVSNGPLISKVYFERLALGLGTLLATLVDLATLLGIFVLAMVGYGVAPTLAILTLPLWLLAIVLLCAGAGLGVGALMVRYRDLLPIVTLGSQLLLYVSPVAYGEAAVPGRLRTIFELNPLTGLLGGLRWCLLDTPLPSAANLLYSAAVAVVAAVVGLMVFRRQERAFSDVI